METVRYLVEASSSNAGMDKTQRTGNRWIKKWNEVIDIEYKIFGHYNHRNNETEVLMNIGIMQEKDKKDN